MALSGNNIVVLSANCQGLQNLQKRRDVLMYFKETNANIVCLQDTHWVEKDMIKVKEIWGHECFISGVKTNSRGVAILLKNNFEYKINTSIRDKEGNFVCINIEHLWVSSIFYHFMVRILTIQPSSQKLKKP